MSRSALKIVVTGPVGAGKTTLIRSLSEIPVVDTEVQVSDRLDKPTTTVALDFGLMRLGEVELHLYGTPGQGRFDFMWEVLMEGAAGFLLLVAGDRPQDFLRARAMMDFITSRFAVPYLLGVTRQDLPRAWAPEDVALYFGLEAEAAVGLVATERTSGVEALIRLFGRVAREGGARYEQD